MHLMHLYFPLLRCPVNILLSLTVPRGNKWSLYADAVDILFSNRFSLCAACKPNLVPGGLSSFWNINTWETCLQ